MANAERRREKLKNAVLFFVKNDKTVGLTKLMKLLFYLDFRLYRDTGESLTGETYEAWDFGPVPADVWRELRERKDAGMNLKSVVKVISAREDPRDEALGIKLAIVPGVKFSDRYFTGREIRELQAVSEMFHGVPAYAVVKASHAPNDPWDVTLKKYGKKTPIDYDLALDGCDEEHKAYIREVRDDTRLLDSVLG
ncbi:MAG: SocA family protein [Deltaproteobacteria bacterium]|jgi:uncharacterized phage-associated protein|nr:SocA family protein [Deltaproteobacteria bacterium]